MSPLFGKRSPVEETVLILDIESGSVGGALLRLSSNAQPKLFSEIRIDVPIFPTHDSDQLTKEIHNATRDVVAHLSTVASRIRTHKTLHAMGDVARVEIFLAPPWTMLGVHGKNLEWQSDSTMAQMAGSIVSTRFGKIPAHVHSIGKAASEALLTLFEHYDATLLCIVMGDVAQVLYIARPNKKLTPTVVAGATIPFGVRGIIRTLQSHAGLSTPEAYSILHLLEKKTSTDQDIPHKEPVEVAYTHFVTGFVEAIESMVLKESASRALILAPSFVSEPLAKAIAQDSRMADYFLSGATISTLKNHHVRPHMRAHAHRPDTILLVEALYVHNHKNF